MLRFSELERAIPNITQKMLSQQLRQLESDQIVERTVYPEVPPRVEYRLSEWGQALCPALDCNAQVGRTAATGCAVSQNLIFAKTPSKSLISYALVRGLLSGAFLSLGLFHRIVRANQI